VLLCVVGGFVEGILKVVVFTSFPIGAGLLTGLLLGALTPSHRLIIFAIRHKV
jgi:hypothetical protein